MKRIILTLIFILGLVSPERTIEHRQAVKRSGTPAMWRKLTECRRYDRTSDRHIRHPLRGSVIGWMLNRGSVIGTPPLPVVFHAFGIFSGHP